MQNEIMHYLQVFIKTGPSQKADHSIPPLFVA